MRNRIASLRQEHTIRGERCHVHAHKGQVERYFLVVKPQQYELPVFANGNYPLAPLGEWAQ